MKIWSYLALVYCVVSVGKGNCCMKLLEEKCVECPEGMHLFRNNCIYDVRNCETYKDGFECGKCKQRFALFNKKCIQSSTETKNSQSQTQPRSSSTPSTIQYIATNIDFKNLDTIKDMDMTDEFSISDEIFRSNYAKEVKNSEILKAEQRKYPNGTIHIAIDYRNSKKEIYNGTIMVNINTFIFKIVSFNIFDEKSLQKSQKQQQDKKTQQNTVIVNQSKVESNIQSNYQKEVKLVQTSNKTSQQQKKVQQPLKKSQQTQNSSQIESLLSKLPFSQVKDEMQLLSDIYFMISKDEVVQKFKEFEDLTPEKVYIATSKGNKQNENSQIQQLKSCNYYKLIFFDKNITTQVIVSCNLTTYEPKLEKVRNVTVQKIQDAQNVSEVNNVSSNAGSVTIISTNILTSEQKNEVNKTENKTKNTTSNPPKSDIVIPTQNTSNPLPSKDTANSFLQITSIKSFPILPNFTLCDSSITTNIYYMIAMETLTSKDKKYSNLKPLQIYLKNQSNSVKRQFLMKFEIPLKGQAKQIWLVTIDVFQSSFKAQITKNELFQTIQPSTILKQQSNQNDSKKDESKSKTPIFPLPTGQGKTVLLKFNSDRILLQKPFL